MNYTEIIGRNLKTLRKESGLSQERLANEAMMSTVHLRNLEHGKGNPTIGTLSKLAECLKTDLITLLKSPD